MFQREKTASDAISSNVSGVIEVLSNKPDSETKTVIAQDAKLNSNNLNLALDAAIEQGIVNQCQIQKNERSHPGYQLLIDQSDTQTDSDRH